MGEFPIAMFDYRRVSLLVLVSQLEINDQGFTTLKWIMLDEIDSAC
jgi:hypothetical protein